VTSGGDRYTVDSTTAQAGSPWTSSIRLASFLGESTSRRAGELVEVLSLAGEQAAVNLLSTEV
jgi:hypothetical protein